MEPIIDEAAWTSFELRSDIANLRLHISGETKARQFMPLVHNLSSWFWIKLEV